MNKNSITTAQNILPQCVILNWYNTIAEWSVLLHIRQMRFWRVAFCLNWSKKKSLILSGKANFFLPGGVFSIKTFFAWFSFFIVENRSLYKSEKKNYLLFNCGLIISVNVLRVSMWKKMISPVVIRDKSKKNIRKRLFF